MFRWLWSNLVLVTIAQIGMSALVIQDTGSWFLGVLIFGMMVVQYDQMRRNTAMSIVLRRVYVDHKYGQKGMNT